MQQIEIIQVTPAQLKKIISEEVRHIIKQELNSRDYGIRKGQYSEKNISGEIALTKKKAAALMGVSPQVINNWVAKRILKETVINNRGYYKKSDLLKLLEGENEKI